MEKRLRSTELMSKMYRERKEGNHLNNNYGTWWSLSGVQDIAIMPHNYPFEYILRTSPFDYWTATMKPEDLITEFDSYEEEIRYSDMEEYTREEIEGKVKAMEEVITLVEGEEPHTVAFTSIPTPCGDVFELVGLAKIDNNGTSYVFSNDLEYLKYLKSKGL